MKSDKTIMKLYDELIYTIKSNTESDWQEKNIIKALSNYLNSLK